MKVFYSPQQVANVSSFSPSARKPEFVVADWKKNFPRVEVVSPTPATKTDLYLVHDPDYVDGVFDLTLDNGFGTKDATVPPSTLWTVGSMVSAVNHAIDTGDTCVSPTSGFHHAKYHTGGGYCTFNGLVLAAVKALKANKRVAILDADMHYGDGTDNILYKLNLGRIIPHLTIGGLEGTPSNVLDFVCKWLHRTLANVDVLIYQAGADPHINDPLGGWMTTEEMRRRDNEVFSIANEVGKPVVWNLAGGYQDMDTLLGLHRATMEECLKFNA